MYTLNDISCIKKDLVDELQHQFRYKGYEGVNTLEAGQVVDMIKDLAQVEKDCMEKCYYETMIESLNEYNDSSYDDRMGYDTRRYANGQYAPKGRGHYSPVHGYTPSMASGYMPPYMDDMDNMNGRSMGNEYGRAYQDFKQSRRYYHETGDVSAKNNEERYAEKHVMETVETIKDIWGEASPDLKKKIKSDMSKLLAEMTI